MSAVRKQEIMEQLVNRYAKGDHKLADEKATSIHIIAIKHISREHLPEIVLFVASKDERIILYFEGALSSE